LHIKLSRIAKVLKRWAKSSLPQIKTAMTICRDAIDNLDKAQEHRPLSTGKLQLKKSEKNRILGLVAIHKSRAIQASRLT
jgi:hypothetical protein